MNDPQGNAPIRLAGFSTAAKVTLTLFLLLGGGGYQVAAYKIYVWHQDADGAAGMTADDLRAVYHGLEKEVTESLREALPSEMLKEVSPGGKMRKHLVKGGETAERALVAWLKAGAIEADFDKAALALAGDPAARQVIRERCVECHNAQGGDAEDLPYADTTEAQPRFELVAKVATPPAAKVTEETRTIRIEPTSVRELIHITHAHILSIPVFALIVAGLFLLTGFGPKFKLILGPLPLLATCVDIGSWWLARPYEPFIHVIAAAGAVFSVAFGVQILCVFVSMWFGRRPEWNRGV